MVFRGEFNREVARGWEGQLEGRSPVAEVEALFGFILRLATYLPLEESVRQIPSSVPGCTYLQSPQGASILRN